MFIRFQFKVLILSLFLFSAPINAKDLTHRLGVGFKNNTSVSVPSIAAVYYADKDLAYTGSVGIDTMKNNSAAQISAGLRSMVFYENNLNCYWSGQVGIINTDDVVNGKNSGVELLALGGVEFFFAGLENLSFTAEAGIGVSSLNSTRTYTTALDPIRAGIIFYF